MVRKLMVFAILSLYSATAIGVPLHYHYCKGELQHISLLFKKQCDTHDDHQHEEVSPFACCLGSESDKCSGEEGPGECCDDESDLLQIDDETVAVMLPGADELSEVAPEAEVIIPIPVKRSADVANYANGPPPPRAPIYLSNCSLVFYG